MENELDNLAPNPTPTVESVLAKPQNQPQQDVLASLAPPVQPGVQAPTEIQPVKPVAPRNPLSELAPQANDVLKTGLLGGLRGGNAAADVSKSSAIATLVKQLAKPAPPEAAPVTTTPPATEAPAPQLPKFTIAPSAFGKGDANGYDYGGVRVELPGDLDMNNAKAVADAVSFNNQVIDWMNDEED